MPRRIAPTMESVVVQRCTQRPRTGLAASVAMSTAVIMLAASWVWPAAADSAPAGREPSTLTLAAPRVGYVGTTATLGVRLRSAGGEPIPDATVYVERRTDGSWHRIRIVTVDAKGNAGPRVRVRPKDANNTFRARWDGDADHAADRSREDVIDARRAATRLRLDGAGRVVDGKRVRLTLRWHTRDGRAVDRRAKVYTKRGGTSQWRLARTPRLSGGRATIRVRPRHDSVWRAVGPGGVWFKRDASRPHRIDNVPPGKVLSLPKAPKPDVHLPAQPRATGGGLNAQVSHIPGSVWHPMVGRSWHRGCPVGRQSLRLITMNYWGFDGYRHRGELVVNRSVVGATVGAFHDMYRGEFPIRAMYRVDRFGWSQRVKGANDYRSMAADNTSAFNCRQVVGRPGRLSPHSYGDAIDLNPWENPYVSRRGTYPDRWWLHRSHPRVAWRSSKHPVVRIFARHGFQWGGRYRDFQHFED